MEIENELLKLLKKAYKKNEIPVAAIIVYKNKIIAKAYNKRHSNKDVIDHAEVIAIKKASKKIKDWRLNECELYTTMKPCDMCKAIIEQSRIKKVYYYLENDKIVNKKTEYVKLESKENDKYKSIVKKSFKNRRI